VRGFEARRRAAAAACFASLGGAAEGDEAVFAGVEGISAPPDGAARGACLDDARDISTS
jgi:hypothetical protein